MATQTEPSSMTLPTIPTKLAELTHVDEIRAFLLKNARDIPDFFVRGGIFEQACASALSDSALPEIVNIHNAIYSPGNQTWRKAFHAEYGKEISPLLSGFASSSLLSDHCDPVFNTLKDKAKKLSKSTSSVKDEIEIITVALQLLASEKEAHYNLAALALCDFINVDNFDPNVFANFFYDFLQTASFSSQGARELILNLHEQGHTKALAGLYTYSDEPSYRAQWHAMITSDFLQEVFLIALVKEKKFDAALDFLDRPNSFITPERSQKFILPLLSEHMRTLKLQEASNLILRTLTVIPHLEAAQYFAAGGKLRFVQETLTERLHKLAAQEKIDLPQTVENLYQLTSIGKVDVVQTRLKQLIEKDYAALAIFLSNHVPQEKSLLLWQQIAEVVKQVVEEAHPDIAAQYAAWKKDQASFMNAGNLPRIAFAKKTVKNVPESFDTNPQEIDKNAFSDGRGVHGSLFPMARFLTQAVPIAKKESGSFSPFYAMYAALATQKFDTTADVQDFQKALRFSNPGKINPRGTDLSMAISKQIAQPYGILHGPASKNDRDDLYNKGLTSSTYEISCDGQFFLSNLSFNYVTPKGEAQKFSTITFLTPTDQPRAEKVPYQIHLPDNEAEKKVAFLYLSELITNALAIKPEDLRSLQHHNLDLSGKNIKIKLPRSENEKEEFFLSPEQLLAPLCVAWDQLRRQLVVGKEKAEDTFNRLRNDPAIQATTRTRFEEEATSDQFKRIEQTARAHRDHTSNSGAVQHFLAQKIQPSSPTQTAGEESMPHERPLMKGP